MDKKSCKKFEALFSFIIDNESIPEQDRKKFEAHLKKCSQCQKKLTELQNLNNTIKSIMSNKIQYHIPVGQLAAFTENNIQSKEEMYSIKTHLQGCKECFKTYKHLKLLNIMKSNFKRKLSSSLIKINIYKWFSRLKNIFKVHRSPIQKLVPVMISVMLIVCIYTIYNEINKPKTLAELAVSTPYPYTKLKLRSEKKYSDFNWEQGMNFYTQGDYSKAITSLKKVIQADSSFYLARFYLGVSYYLKGHIEKAKYNLELYILQQPDKAKGYWYLTQVYLKMNHKENALKMIQKLTELSENPFIKKAEKLKKRLTKLI